MDEMRRRKECRLRREENVFSKENRQSREAEEHLKTCIWWGGGEEKDRKRCCRKRRKWSLVSCKLEASDRVQ